MPNHIKMCQSLENGKVNLPIVTSVAEERGVKRKRVEEKEKVEPVRPAPSIPSVPAAVKPVPQTQKPISKTYTTPEQLLEALQRGELSFEALGRHLVWPELAKVLILSIQFDFYLTL